MHVSIADESHQVNHPAELHQVLAHLRDQCHAPELALNGDSRRLTGGFWAELWALPLQGQGTSGLPEELVLRLAPDATLAAWEVAVQSGVAAQGYPTPRIHSSYTAPAAGERAWYVMEFAVGAPLIGNLSGARAIRSAQINAAATPNMGK